MTVRRTAAAALILGALAALAVPVAAEHQARVLIVSMPRLTWAAVEEEQPPALRALLEQSAVASVSVRTIGADTTLAEGYATIGAGNRAADVEEAGAAYDAEEQLESGMAAEIYERRTAVRATGAVLHLAAPAMASRNEGLFYGADPGRLGSALAAADRRIGVIGNADGSGDPFDRSVALAAMDRTGQVPLGEVGEQLLRDDVTAPFGSRLDPDAVAEAARGALNAGADVLVVEMSDLERADAVRADYSTPAAEEVWRLAVRRSDQLLGRLLTIVGDDASVIVVTPASPRGRERLGVFALRAEGVSPGTASSPSTRRAGYVTLSDVAPTALELLHVEAPDSMSGTPITGDGGSTALSDRIDARVAAEDTSFFRDDVFTGVTGVFISLQVVAYLLTVLALARPHPVLRSAAQIGLLGTLALPALAFLSGAFRYDELGPVAYTAVLTITAFAMGTLLGLAGPRWRALGALSLVSATLLILVVDILVGGPLQIDTVFGYSPIIAGRFSGYGNQAFALVAISAIVATVGWWAHAGGSRRSLIAGSLALALVVVAIGHPSLGSDVGGVLAAVPAFALLVVLLSGRQPSWRVLLALGAAAVVVVGAFAAIDLARPEPDRTHLGRFVSDLATGDSDVTDVIRRKAQTNLRILTSSVWSIVVAVAVVFFGWLAWRPSGTLRELQMRVPGLRATLLAGLVAGGIGFALNDSGIAVPAMMLAVALPWVGLLALDQPPTSAPGNR